MLHIPSSNIIALLLIPQEHNFNIYGPEGFELNKAFLSLTAVGEGEEGS